MKLAGRSKKVLGILFLGIAVWAVVFGLASRRERSECLALDAEDPNVENLDAEERQLMLDKALLVLGGTPLVEEADKVVSAQEATAEVKAVAEKKAVVALKAESNLKEELANRSIPMATPSIKPSHVVSPYPPYNILDVTGLESGAVAADPTTVALDQETGKLVKDENGLPDLLQAKWFRVP